MNGNDVLSMKCVYFKTWPTCVITIRTNEEKHGRHQKNSNNGDQEAKQHRINADIRAGSLINMPTFSSQSDDNYA